MGNEPNLMAIHPAWVPAARDIIGLEAHHWARQVGTERWGVTALGPGKPRRPSHEDVAEGLTQAWSECPEVLREYVIAIVDGSLKWPAGRPLAGPRKLMRWLDAKRWVGQAEILAESFRARRDPDDTLAMVEAGLLTQAEYHEYLQFRGHPNGTLSVIRPLDTALDLVARRAHTSPSTLRTWRRDLRRGWVINTPG
jgi:hypothetical protein